MKTNQVSFAGGLIDGEMIGRIDLENNQTGLKTCKNFRTLPHGPAQNRAGLEYIKEHVDGGVLQGRLASYIFDTDQAYILEFGHLSLRLHLEGATVLETAQNISLVVPANPPFIVFGAAHGLTSLQEIFVSGVGGTTEINNRFYRVLVIDPTTIALTDLRNNAIDGSGWSAYTSGGTAARVYTITTPYSHLDLADLVFDQVEDVMTITSTKYDRKELKRIGATNWTLTDITDGPTIAIPNNVSVIPNPLSGTIREYYVVTAVSEELLEESLPSTGPAITGATQANPVVISSAAHGRTTGDHLWIQDVLGMTELNNDEYQITVIDPDTFSLNGIDGTGFTAYTSGGHWKLATVNDVSAGSNVNTIQWDAVTGAIRYSVYKLDNGVFGFIGQTAALEFADDNIKPDPLTSPPIDQQFFTENDDRPGTVAHFDERRIFGNTNNNKGGGWMSRTGTEQNFTKSIPSQPDDAINFRLKSDKFQKIRHFIALNELLIFTAESEWRMIHDPLEGVTPTTVFFREQSSVGCSMLKPLKILDSVLFVAEVGGHIHDLNYSAEKDRYRPRNISRLAPSLVKNKNLVDWDFIKSPDPTVYAPRSDGSWLGLTYLPDQEPNVIGFHEHDTNNGSVESVAVIPESNGQYMAYFLVKRVIQGVDRRFIERLHVRDFTDIEDAFFVDSGVTIEEKQNITGISLTNPVVVTINGHNYTAGARTKLSDILGTVELNDKSYTIANPTTNTFELQTTDAVPVNVDGTGFTAYISGGISRKEFKTASNLWHLEGRKVAIFGDGSVEPQQTVANGSLTFARWLSRAHVGEPITADLETLPVILPVQGFGKGTSKAVNKVFLQVEESRELKAGPNFDQLTPKAIRELEAWGEPTRPVSGEMEITIQSDWNRRGQIAIRQDNPVPVTILSFAQDVETSE